MAANLMLYKIKLEGELEAHTSLLSEEELQDQETTLSFAIDNFVREEEGRSDDRFATSHV